MTSLSCFSDRSSSLSRRSTLRVRASLAERCVSSSSFAPLCSARLASSWSLVASSVWFLCCSDAISCSFWRTSSSSFLTLSSALEARMRVCQLLAWGCWGREGSRGVTRLEGGEGDASSTRRRREDSRLCACDSGVCLCTEGSKALHAVR